MSLTAYPTLRLKLTMPQALKLQFLPAVPGSNAAAAADRAEQAAQDAQNAANTAVAATANKVDKAGDVMTGFLTLNANPTSNLQAATKQYVDAHAGGIVTINSQDGPDITLVAGTNVTIDSPSADQIRIAATGGGGGGAPIGAEYITSTVDATLTAERVLTDTASITWDRTTAGQIKANTAAGGGNVSNSGTPTAGQYGKWATATTIQGVAPATVLSDIGAAPVGAEYIASTANATLTAERVLTDTATVTWDRTTAGQIKATAVGSGAPVGAEYITSAIDATLTAERVLTDTATVMWDRTIAGQIKASAPFGVRYDTAQTLTAAQKSQARANIDDLKKNYIINGAMMVSQENGSTAGTATIYYPVDQFSSDFINAGTQTFQQVASFTPAGSPNRFRVTATVADASVAAGDYCAFSQILEGLRIADLRFGSASAKTITLQFGVKAPAGTYCVSFLNGAANRCYIAEYVIAAGEANTDVVKSITIPGDASGTWTVDNTRGMFVRWALMTGTSQQAVAGSWGTSIAFGTANQFNFMGTNGNVFELFDVGLYEGTVAPAFQVPDYIEELQICRRYWQIGEVVSDFIATAGSQNSAFAVTFSPPMRATPTAVQTPSVAAVNVASSSFFTTSFFGTFFQVFNTAAGRAYFYGIVVANARL